MHENQKENLIKCNCGKLIAKERGGKIYLFCKSCRKEVELEIIRESQKTNTKQIPQESHSTSVR